MDRSPTRLRVVASKPHYARHIRPVADLLSVTSDPRAPTLIASANDLGSVRRGVPVAHAEHGAGQRYAGVQHRCWGDGPGLERVGLFLVPSERVAEGFRANYPDARVEVVGCPALDKHFREDLREESPRTDIQGRDGLQPVVALTFHWAADLPGCPEAGTALDHYRDSLPAIVAGLRAEGCEVLGHGHPRFRRAERMWRDLGVPFERDWDAVLSRADCVVGDNTSALPESAAVGAAVVWLNCPQYRRDVEHGGRFWDWPRGQPSADDPSEVVPAVLAALAGEGHEAREAMVPTVYAHLGEASERAAVALRRWLSG